MIYDYSQPSSLQVDLASMGLHGAVKVTDDTYQSSNAFVAIVAQTNGATVSFRSYARNGNHVEWTSHAMAAGEYIVGDIRLLNVTAGAVTAYFQPNNLTADIT